MIDMLAAAAVRDRDNNPDFLPHGTAYKFLYVHPLAYTDTPVADAARRTVREEVARYVRDHGHPHVTADDVTVTEVTPDEMHDAWRKHAPMSPPPVSTYALIGHWTPPKEPRP